MEISSLLDYKLPGNLFKNESTYDPTNTNSNATNETRVLWRQKLAFWTVFLTIFALLVVCGLILCIKQTLRSLQRREQNIERQLQMMHINRPRRNMIPRASISSNLRITDEGNTERPSSQIRLPTDNTAELEIAEIDPQKAPKELMIAELTQKVKEGNLSLEQPLDTVTPSEVADILCGRENIKGKIIGEDSTDMDQEDVALEKDRGGCKSNQFFPVKRASKALNASA